MNMGVLARKRHDNLKLGISISEIVVFMQDKPFCHLLSIITLPHFRQDDEALLFVLDESVKRVMVKRIVLHPLPNAPHLHLKRRVADLAFQQNFDQLAKKSSDLLSSLIPLDAPNAQRIDHPSCMLLQCR